MKPLILNEGFLKDIYMQAEGEYPHECCGMVMGPAGDKTALTRLRPCKNVYNEFHEKDPDNFPRTAKTAYFIDPRELLKIQKENREASEEIRIIYHSHINTGAYFSAEDKQVATFEGGPAYPGVQYLVVSVVEGKVADNNMFIWNDDKKDFLS